MTFVILSFVPICQKGAKTDLTIKEELLRESVSTKNKTDFLFEIHLENMIE